jgi:two-component system, HptB-dependent secretion and biofilm response regulator
MNILIVDDTETNRLILGAMLDKDGHVVSEAANGHEGVALFEREQPDLVIMDIMMPVMDGYHATTLIKQRSGDRFVPVIFLTAVTDEMELAKGIAHGGDDFLTKPYSHVLLRAKIQALNRIRELHALVKAQHDALLLNRKKDARDQEVARSIFHKVLGAGCLDHPNLAYRLFPAELLSGDLLLAAMTPHGLLHVVIGDFTGHGLAAAVGAVPVAETFYSMTHSGFGIGSIAAEINRKLRLILPTNLFCAACLLEWDPAGRRITVWSGGMPDGLVVRPNDGLLRRLHSRHLPLGLLNADQFDAATETLEVHDADRIYLYSDGLIEAHNPAGEMFGSERLVRQVVGAPDAGGICERIEQALTHFCAGEPAHDDIALLQLICDPALSCATSSIRDTGPPDDLRSRSWRVDLALDANALHDVDPLPTLMRTLTDLQNMAQYKQPIFTILAELLANAIDHGLLGLDSALKRTPEGFVEYYRRRDRLLRDLPHGQLRIGIRHDRQDHGGRFVIRVEDSGAGFPFHRALPALDTNGTLSARGIPLVRELCHSLTYEGNGNTVEAVYLWA